MTITKKQIDMTEGSIARQLISFAIPLLLGDILQQLYNVADSMIVGNLVSKQALAAVSATSNIVNVLVGFFTGMSVGATVVVSRNFGAKDEEKLNIAVRTIIWMTVAFGVLFTGIGLAGMKPMLRLLGTPDDVYADAKTYLTIYFCGILVQFLYNMLAATLRAIGDSRRPTMILLLCSVLNIVLDLFSIAVLGMGVAGAAIATVIAQFISAAFLLKFVLGVPSFGDLKLGSPILDGGVMRQIAAVGVPIGVRKSVISFSNTVVISFVNRFGSGAMAAWGIQNRVDQIINLTITSMSNAVTTFVAQNLGAKKRDRIKKGISTTFVITFALTLFYIAVFVAARVPIIKLFNQDADVIEFGSLIFTTMIPLQFINTITHTCAGALQGYGESKGPMVIMLVCYVLVRQIYLQVGWPFFQTFRFVMLAFPFTWACCAALTFLYTLRKMKKLNAGLDPRAEA